MKVVDGITLIEVMVVLCLIMFLSSLVIINISFLDEIITRAQVDRLYAVCYNLRQQAMATHREIVLKCDMHNNSYFFDGQSEKLSQQVCFGFFDGAKGPPGNPEKVISSAVTFPSKEIHFYPTGIISSGTMYLTDNKKRHMYAISNAVSTVSYLRLYRYSNGAWKLYENVLEKK